MLRLYKAEMFKSFKRKTNYVLLVPGILSFIIALGMKSGSFSLSMDSIDTVNTLYSAMDYLFLVLNLLIGFAILSIIYMLISSYQFASDIENGQIKLALLRSGSRSQVVLAKFLSLVTNIMLSFGFMILMAFVGYYLFMGNSNMGNAQFGMTLPGYTNMQVIKLIGFFGLEYILLGSVTFFAGLYLNPFMSFIVTILFMFVEMNSVNFASFFRFLPYNMGISSIYSAVSNSDMLISIGIGLVIVCGMIVLTTQLFQTKDIK